MSVEQYWPFLVGAFITPITQWLKLRLPGDWPITPVGISLILSVLLALVLAKILSVPATTADLVLWVLGMNVTAQVTHAAKKTVTK